MKKILVPIAVASVLFLLSGCSVSDENPVASPGPAPSVSSSSSEDGTSSNSITYGDLNASEKEVFDVLSSYKKVVEEGNDNALDSFKDSHSDYLLGYATISGKISYLEAQKDSISALYQDDGYSILKTIQPTEAVRKFSEDFLKQFDDLVKSHEESISVSSADGKITFSEMMGNSKVLAEMDIPDGIKVEGPTSTSVLEDVISISGFKVNGTEVTVASGKISYGQYVSVSGVPES